VERTVLRLRSKTRYAQDELCLGAWARTWARKGAPGSRRTSGCREVLIGNAAARLDENATEDARAAEKAIRPRPGRPEAARAIWDWRNPRAVDSHDTKPLRRSLIRQGLIGLAVGSAFLFFGQRTLGTVGVSIGGTAFLIGLSGVAALMLGWHGIWELLTKVVTTTITFVVLMLLFVGFVWPVGMVVKRGENRRFRREILKGASTYWTKRTKPLADPTRQF